MSEKCNCGHDHEHEDCCCGCGNESEMDGIITLVDDEGIEHEFEIADVLEDNGSEYLALIPVLEDIDGEAEDSGELVVLKIVAEGVDEFLEAIEDEEEFNRISAIFMERLGETYDFVEE